MAIEGRRVTLGGEDGITALNLYGVVNKCDIGWMLCVFTDAVPIDAQAYMVSLAMSGKACVSVDIEPAQPRLERVAAEMVVRGSGTAFWLDDGQGHQRVTFADGSEFDPLTDQ